MFVMILLWFRRSRSPLVVSSASATALIPLFGFGSSWQTSGLTDSLVLYGARCDFSHSRRSSFARNLFSLVTRRFLFHAPPPTGKPGASLVTVKKRILG